MRATHDDDWPDLPDWRPVVRPSTFHAHVAAAVLALAWADAAWTKWHGAAAVWLLQDADAAWWASVAGIDITALRAAVRGRMGA